MVAESSADRCRVVQYVLKVDTIVGRAFVVKRKVKLLATSLYGRDEGIYKKMLREFDPGVRGICVWRPSRIDWEETAV
jgi:hypothetical protein